MIAMLAAPTLSAQEVEDVEVIEVSGIRASLTTALLEKRETTNLVEIIQAEDIGKLPDQNLAEVLENITGIQITRTAGVGTGVQIRGSNSNNVLINGVQTVSSGTGRGGISFEDVSASIIAGVEVAKASDAKTIEGSVGGTVNLRTIRPLELDERLVNVRVQGEDSSLTTDGIQPRFSAVYGDNWDTDSGKFGFVFSGSLTKQESSSFRPRVDRDGSLVENCNAVVVRSGEAEDIADRPACQDFDFLGIQFLNQEYENFEYETTNISTTFEYAPNDNTKFFVDVVLTDQERRQDSTRVQGSGVSSVLNYNVPTEFEMVNYGSLDGVALGSIQTAVRGTIEPDLSVDDDDPNLRFSSDTGARLTDTSLFRIGGEWQGENLFASFEISSADSDTTNPNLSTTLNFINPNAPLDGLDDDGNITANTSNDNAVPFIYDLTGGALTFGINFDSPMAPTVAQLMDPANVVLDQVTLGRNETNNSLDALRADFTYFLEDSPVTSIDFGFRLSKRESTFNDISDNIGGFSKMVDSPSGSLFSELLVAGPDNFGDADGRELAMRNFIIVDPDLAFNDPDYVLNTLESALIAHDASPDLSNLVPSSSAFFSIAEETQAIYAQANFEFGDLLTGNFGLRHLETTVDSTGNTITSAGDVLTTISGDYSYTLPKLNIVMTPHDDVVLRLGWGQDIRRPDFSDLNTSVSYDPNINRSVSIGNPGLEPQEITTLDLAVEWYFAEAAVVSIGYFDKEISNLFVSTLDSSPRDANGYFEYTDTTCAGGGIFNPVAQGDDFLAPLGVTGACVDKATQVNDSAKTTQTGIEMAVQYDLSSFEDDLGWASGFGFMANYTIQEYKGGSVVNESAGRGTDIFNAINGIYNDADFVKVTAVQGLLDFSENAYNITTYYEKHGLSARLRYTWREAFRTDDTAGGASRNSTLGFPVYTHDRGQLNASVSYDVNEQLNIGVEAVNLNKAGVTQSCVNEGAILCFQGLADRRITFGASYRF
ncbi:TonB-dependent receptor [Paraglaciecola aquimarina]|uniref:TonB-dependent receptor n=2 Tax=Paraglaciecola aquimarina TaxID=1235557 RepID=A0ABU3SV40_9ALTE|nr:TonB-dependent receptor [Paraglaciecola aquimarina]MDU0353802.1 TonB-dependent receptor [Paraglaciecola aquimarina]